MTINESARRSAGKLIAAPQNRRGRTVELAHRPPSSRLTHLGRRWFRPAFRPGAASVAERPSQRRQGSLHQMPHLPRPPAPLAKGPIYDMRKLDLPRRPVARPLNGIAATSPSLATPTAAAGPPRGGNATGAAGAGWAVQQGVGPGTHR